MQRDLFMNQLINDRGRPAFTLPATIKVTNGDIVNEHLFECGDCRAPSLQDLCRELASNGTTATHLQVWDARDGFRRPACFMEIADTAAFQDTRSTASQRRAKRHG
jgi:hypothetical protein